jgi:hypothetical protein
LRGFAADPLRAVEVDEIEGVDPPTADDIRSCAALELGVLVGSTKRGSWLAWLTIWALRGLALDHGRFVKKRF